jgi:hypothetical protein
MMCSDSWRGSIGRKQNQSIHVNRFMMLQQYAETKQYGILLVVVAVVQTFSTDCGGWDVLFEFCGRLVIVVMENFEFCCDVKRFL